MNLAQPLALAWLLLAVPIVMLYLRRAVVRREPTAMAMFWDQILGQSKEGLLQKHVLGVSLAVQLAILATLVIALAEPRLSRPQNVALLVDNTGDSTATRQTTQSLLVGMHADDHVSIFSTSPITAHYGPTSDPAAATKALEAISAGSGPLAMKDIGSVLDAIDRDGFSKRVLISANTLAQSDLGIEVISPGEGNLAAESAKVFGPPWRALWWLFAALAAVVLAVQWPLYHRRRLV